ncbi:hypothetical protein R1sor_007427 [Riccia sorocarpa]|uniref:Uncharacterized protein n=1 Tax=Riccia sorocarpa TaxID=122646 RepID=A0ABD3HUL4_9MARC
MQVEAEEGINLVDASYGSDDDDDTIGNQTEEEDPNEGFQDEINNAEQTRSEREGSATETKREQLAEGRRGRNVDDSRGKAADLQEELSSLQECVLHTFYEVERDLFTALRATNLADARDAIKNLYSKLQEGRAFIWRSLELITDKKYIIDSIVAIPVEQPADAPRDSTLKYHSLGDGGNLDASKEGDHNMHSDDSDEDSSSSDE